MRQALDATAGGWVIRTAATAGLAGFIVLWLLLDPPEALIAVPLALAVLAVDRGILRWRRSAVGTLPHAPVIFRTPA